MVDKILNKDKNYNLCVSKVADKQKRIVILTKDIQSLEAEYKKLKTAGKLLIHKVKYNHILYSYILPNSNRRLLQRKHHIHNCQHFN